MSRISLQYADITNALGRCENCSEIIDSSDGDKYVVVGLVNPVKFHIPCFEQFILGLLEFQRIFIIEKQQEKLERKLN